MIVVLFLLENGMIKMTEHVARRMYELKQLQFFLKELTSFVHEEECEFIDEEYEKQKKMIHIFVN